MPGEVGGAEALAKRRSACRQLLLSENLEGCEEAVGEV
jgi:hypothetical protein